MKFSSTALILAVIVSNIFSISTIAGIFVAFGGVSGNTPLWGWLVVLGVQWFFATGIFYYVFSGIDFALDRIQQGDSLRERFSKVGYEIKRAVDPDSYCEIVRLDFKTDYYLLGLVAGGVSESVDYRKLSGKQKIVGLFKAYSSRYGGGGWVESTGWDFSEFMRRVIAEADRMEKK